MMFMVTALIVIGGVSLSLWALALGLDHRRELRALAERLARIERESFAKHDGLATDLPPATPAAARPSATVPPAPSGLPPASMQRKSGTLSLEQLVGGIWLQNIGSALLLLGSFFLILWGYTNGRFGPGLLVAAGVAFGLILVWRGDRAARQLPPFGHALIGVGLGVVYLTFYLGHYTLHVLSAEATFTLLALAALATVSAGLHYRSEAVATLGVFGAFLPRLLAVWLPLHGFALGPVPLLGYLVVANAAVLATVVHPSASGRWVRGRLEFGALLLTSFTWLLAFAELRWGWSVQIGLSALFAGLGLAALPRLTRSGERAPALVLAVIVTVPLGWLAASWPFIAYTTPTGSGLLLLGMALVWTAAAWWTERSVAEDVWRALVAAAVLFVTIALQRTLGQDQTPMAWCLEAAALVWLGLRGRSWLRFCGYVVGFLGAVWLLVRLALDQGWSNSLVPFLYPDGLRNLASLAALISIAILAGRRSAALAEPERLLGRLWTAGVNLLVLAWSALESGHVARALHGTGGRWTQPPSITDLPSGQQLMMLAAVMTSITWLVQAVMLMALGWRQANAFLRWLGLGLFGFTVAKFLFFDLAAVDVFWRFLIAIMAGAALLGVSYFYQRRAHSHGSAPPPEANPPRPAAMA